MDLDDELRDLFNSDRLDVPVRADAEEIIVSGARRLRRRRIATATAGGALAAVLVIVAGIVLASGDPDAMPPATTSPSTPPAGESSEVTTSSSTSAAAAGPPMTMATVTSTTTTTTTTRTTEAGPPDPGSQVLGPTGFGAVQLGMTLDEALATGQVGNHAGTHGTNHGVDCEIYQLLSGGSVVAHFFVADTVQSITPEQAQTAEGVGPGWTIEQVKEVYPDLDEEAAMAPAAWVTVKVPQNPQASYALRFIDGVLLGMYLGLTGQTCGR